MSSGFRDGQPARVEFLCYTDTLKGPGEVAVRGNPRVTHAIGELALDLCGSVSHREP